MRAVRLAVDHQRAGAANALAAVVVKSDGFFALPGELVIDHIQHLEKRHVGVEVGRLVLPEPAGGVRVLLAPDFELNLHEKVRGRVKVKVESKVRRNESVAALPSATGAIFPFTLTFTLTPYL